MTTETRRRASLYVRLSVAADAANTSLKGMTDDLRALCRREGFEEVALHVDDGLSGAVRNRPAFRAWLDDALSGRADVLAAWHVDRMTREGLNVAALVLDVVEGKDPETGRVVRAPVRLIDTRGTDSEGGDSWRMGFVVKAEVARAERERIRDRVTASKARLARAHRFAGGPPPYGYRSVPRADGGRALEVDPEEAEHVRRAARDVLGGQSLYATAIALNEAGSTPRRARAWALTSLRVVLTGDAVLGRIRHRGELVRDDDGEPVQAWPAILDVETVETLRDLTRPKPVGDRRKRATRLLSGRVVCAGCDGPMRVASSVVNGRTVYRYACRARADGRVCAGQASVTAERLDEHLERLTLDRWGAYPVVEARLERRTPAEVRAVVRRLDEAARALTQPGADVERLVAEIGALRERRADLEAEPQTSEHLVYTGRSVAEVWRDGVTVQRRVLGGVLDRVVIRPGERGRHGLDERRLSIAWADSPSLVTPWPEFGEGDDALGYVVLSA